jgi:hypothetical protein
MRQKELSQITVSEWPRNKRESIRITLDNYKGRAVVSLRTWYKNECGVDRPGRAGITLDVSHTPKLAKGFARAEARARKRGMLEET